MRADRGDAGHRGVSWPPGGGPGEEAQDRSDLRLHRASGRRRLRPARPRGQDHDRLLRQEGRGGGLSDRGHLRGRPEQARGGHQRGGAPDRAGEGRHAARLLLLGAVRARGRPGRAAQEVHVDHHLHLLGGARGPQSQVRLPHPAERPPVRPDVDGLSGQERQGQAGQGAQGSAGGHHPRGRRLRGRRLEGQRGRGEEGGLQHRAEGGLRGHRARPVPAGHQAQAGPARRHLPHRLQPRHHAVPAPVARAGPALQRSRRPRSGLRRLRQAEGIARART